jgi:RNA polymerase sigma factor (TIGR02999 family)
LNLLTDCAKTIGILQGFAGIGQTGMSEITRILERAQAGDTDAANQLLPLVYDELRRLAAAKLAREAPGQTLQATALVHEAWLRLGGDNQPTWQNRSHFLGAAAEAMRRILVENARRKLRLKRGGGNERVELHESAIEAPIEDEKVLQVHEALDTLAAEDPQKAEIVKLRFFVGLNHQEIATILGVNEKTVRRHWEVAKVRLFQQINSSLA